MIDNLILGQKPIETMWMLCFAEWGIDDYVTIITDAGDRLILVEIVRGNDNAFLRYVPIKRNALKTYMGQPNNALTQTNMAR